MEAQELAKALKASNPKGLTIPWAYTRRQVAKAWGVPPWAVDQAPWWEVENELRIMAIEADAAAFRKRTGRRG